MLSLSAGPQGIAWHHHRSSIWWFLPKITSLQVQCKQSSALEHIKIKLVWKIVRDSLAGVNDLHVYSEELGVLLVGLWEDVAWQIFKERKWVLLAIETVCTENGCDRGGFDISVTAPVVRLLTCHLLHLFLPKHLFPLLLSYNKSDKSFHTAFHFLCSSKVVESSSAS